MMWSQAPSFASAVTAAVLCLLATAPHAARACVADNDRCCMVDGVGVCESTEVVCVNNNRCRPCGGLNEFECIGALSPPSTWAIPPQHGARARPQIAGAPPRPTAASIGISVRPPLCIAVVRVHLYTTVLRCAVMCIGLTCETCAGSAKFS